MIDDSSPTLLELGPGARSKGQGRGLVRSGQQRRAQRALRMNRMRSMPDEFCSVWMLGHTQNLFFPGSQTVSGEGMGRTPANCPQPSSLQLCSLLGATHVVQIRIRIVTS